MCLHYSVSGICCVAPAIPPAPACFTSLLNRLKIARMYAPRSHTAFLSMRRRYLLIASPDILLEKKEEAFSSPCSLSSNNKKKRGATRENCFLLLNTKLRHHIHQSGGGGWRCWSIQWLHLKQCFDLAAGMKRKHSRATHWCKRLLRDVTKLFQCCDTVSFSLFFSYLPFSR